MHTPDLQQSAAAAAAAAERCLQWLRQSLRRPVLSYSSECIEATSAAFRASHVHN